MSRRTAFVALFFVAAIALAAIAIGLPSARAQDMGPTVQWGGNENWVPSGGWAG